MSVYEQGSEAPKSSFSERMGCLVILVIVCGIGYFVITGLTSSEDRFKAGDCLRLDDGKYKSADCDDDEATSKVYALKASDDECVEVPGTSSSYYEPTAKGGYKTYCVGDKDVDLSKTINTIAVGDCVVVEGVESAEKSSCKASHTRPVLKILKDVSKSDVEPKGYGFGDGACQEAGAKKTKLAFGWGLEGQGGLGSQLDALSWDRVLCLGA